MGVLSIAHLAEHELGERKPRLLTATQHLDLHTGSSAIRTRTEGLRMGCLKAWFIGAMVFNFACFVSEMSTGECRALLGRARWPGRRWARLLVHGLAGEHHAAQQRLDVLHLRVGGRPLQRLQHRQARLQRLGLDSSAR